MISFSSESHASKLNAWKADLREEITMEQWSDACKAAQTWMGNTRLRLLQYNWLMRVYITPEKLNKFNSKIPDLCDRCWKDKGTLLHCLWMCPRIKEFWEEVRVTVQEVLSIRIELEPKFFLLGLYPKGHNINHHEQIFLNICLLQAKRMITLRWKKMGKPSITQWFKELSLCLPLEKITYTLKGKQEMFEKVWGRYKQYMKNNNLSHLMEEPSCGRLHPLFNVSLLTHDFAGLLHITWLNP